MQCVMSANFIICLYYRFLSSCIVQTEYMPKGFTCEKNLPVLFMGNLFQECNNYKVTAKWSSKIRT